MPHELPVDWIEIEKACIAGVPQRQVAKDIAEKTPGLTTDQLYKAIRKRASRERWPIPASIMRRARAQAMVATGAAQDAKQGATWRKGESGRNQAGAVLAVLGMEHSERGAAELLERLDAPTAAQCDTVAAEVAGIAAGGSGATGAVLSPFGATGAKSGDFGGRGALQRAAVTATDLVTTSLAERGQSGLSLALDAALASLRQLEASEPLPARNANDLLTLVKAVQAAAGLDKPQVAVAVSLNSAGNVGIATWESA